MTNSQKFFLFLLRVSAGWMFFYAGITKVLNPQWSAEGYLKGAKAFTWFFQMLLDPSVLPIVNFINKWGLTLLGISLILGLFVRFQFPLGRSAYGFILHSSRLPLSQSEFLHCGPAYYLYRRSIIFRHH